MERLPEFLQIGGNPTPIIKGYYEALGTPNMDELFPKNMTTEEEQQRKKMLEVQEGQLKALQQQNSMLQYQLQLAKTDTDRRVFEAQTKAQKDQAELQQKAMKLENEIMQMQRKMLVEDAEMRMKMERQVVELQKIKAETLQKLAEVDKTVTETAELEQALQTGDVNALANIADDDLLQFIGVQRNG